MERGFATGRRPIFADANLLVEAFERGNASALAEITAGQTFVTPNQFREFLDVSTSIQRKARRAFLENEGIALFSGPQAGQIALSIPFQEVFTRLLAVQGRGDAALVAFAKSTGFFAVTSERRLFNFLTHTLSQLGVPIRRVR